MADLSRIAGLLDGIRPTLERWEDGADSWSWTMAAVADLFYALEEVYEDQVEGGKHV